MGKDLIKIFKKNIHWILLILFTIVIVIVINNQFKNKESFRISAAEDLRIENMTHGDFFQLLENMKDSSNVKIVINGQNITNDILKLVENILEHKDEITEDKYQDLHNKYIASLEPNKEMWTAAANLKGDMDGFSIGGPNDDDDGLVDAAIIGGAAGLGDLTNAQLSELFGFMSAVGIGLGIGALFLSYPAEVFGLSLLAVGGFVALDEAQPPAAPQPPPAPGTVPYDHPPSESNPTPG